MRRFFSTSAEELRKSLLRRTIRDLENEIIKSRYKYLIKPLRYDGQEQELIAEVERLKKEIARHAVRSISDVGIPPEWKLR
jgi:hypothetical protein